MKAPLTSMLLFHAVLGLASPTTNIATRQAVAGERTRISSSATSHHHRGQDATTAPAAYGFLALVESWQHRRASGYYVLADACGDVITVYHDPSHVRLAGCHVTQCTEALRDGEAEAVRRRSASSSSSTWCNGSALRSADSSTSLLGHLRCLATEYAGRAGKW
ncbi:hypothetical protein PG991_009989 [Apiospora marii]|uniref:Uncharacterized protein n=1 Tax=Apiospora marii TaxID=335849 RepID=A0ABR1RH60_9PEZI